MSRRMNAAFGILTLSALGVPLACGVDDRVLSQSLDCAGASCAGSQATGGLSGGNSSASGGRTQSSGGRMNSTTEGQGGDVGNAGAGGVPNVDIACPDLDDNTRPDCQETLALNPTFDVDVEGWRPETYATTTWNFINAQAGEKSGSILVESNVPANTSSGDAFVYTGVTQCLALDGLAQEHQIFAQMYSDGEMVTAYGSVVGRLFASQDCSGSPLSTTPSANQGSTGNWFPMQTTVFTADASVRSLMIELRIGKLATRTGSVSLRFDNVMVR